MTALSESRWWDRARPDTGESSEWEAYAAAQAADGSSPLGDLQDSIDDMLAAEDATAERGGLPERVAGWYIAAILAVLAGVLAWNVGGALVRLAWGWFS